MTEDQNNQPDDNMSAEEIKAAKKRMDDYHKESIPFLKRQLEYENLITGIQEARYKRFMMQSSMQQPDAPKEAGRKLRPMETPTD